MIMITEQTIKETLTILKVAYPNALKDLSKEDAYIMIKLWYEDFKDCKKDIFMQAVKNVRSKSVFFPSIADIKNEIQEIENPKLKLNANEEWYKVIELVRKYGVYKQDLIMEELNPITARVVENVGLYNICSSQRIEVQKRQFKELFNDLNGIKSEEKIEYQEPLYLEEGEDYE